MASTIESFLKLKPKQFKKKTVTVKLQGQDFEFEIREIDPETLSEIQMAHTVAIPSSVQGGPTTEGANPLKLSLDVCLEGILSPDLRDAQLQNHFGVATERDLIYEMFKSDTQSLGELFTAIIELSSQANPDTQRGTDPKLVQEAKN